MKTGAYLKIQWAKDAGVAEAAGTRCRDEGERERRWRRREAEGLGFGGEGRGDGVSCRLEPVGLQALRGRGCKADYL